MKKAKTGKWNDYPDISTTSSFTDTTGMMPTPPLTDEQFELNHKSACICYR